MSRLKKSRRSLNGQILADGFYQLINGSKPSLYAVVKNGISYIDTKPGSYNFTNIDASTNKTAYDALISMPTIFAPGTYKYAGKNWVVDKNIKYSVPEYEAANSIEIDLPIFEKLTTLSNYMIAPQFIEANKEQWNKPAIIEQQIQLIDTSFKAGDTIEDGVIIKKDKEGNVISTTALNLIEATKKGNLWVYVALGVTGVLLIRKLLQ